VLMVARLTAGVRGVAKSGEPFRSGKRGFDLAVWSGGGTVVAFGHNSSARNPSVGELFTVGGVGAISPKAAAGEQGGHGAKRARPGRRRRSAAG